MESSSAGAGGEASSPTLPLPPPKAGQIAMEDFIEGATRAVLRTLGSSSLNPQPLPPQPEAASVELDLQPEPPGVSGLNPQPIPPGIARQIVVGVIITPAEISAATEREAGG